MRQVILTAGTIKSNGTIESTGRIKAGEYLHLNGQATLNAKCTPNGLVGRDSTGRVLSCVNGIWKNNNSTLRNMTWMLTGGKNYGNACQIYLNNSGLASQGWMLTGSDACTEDDDRCTIDNLKCYAVKLAN